MALKLTRAPSIEPVSIADAKLHARIDGTIEDAYVASLIETSRLHLEAALSLALISQDWTWQLDAWPDPRCLELPLRPAITVDSVRIYDAAGAGSVVPATTYVTDLASRPARLVATEQWPQPGRTHSGIEIDFTAGFGTTAASVPAPLRQAVLMLVAHWYENREPLGPDRPTAAIPPAISELVMPWREVRL